MQESDYQILFQKYLQDEIDTTAFIDQFFNYWQYDRDHHTQHDDRFARLINRISTSCDCCEELPKPNLFEISEKELRDELRLFHHIWFGETIV